MIVSAHQPNFLPWLGFFDKMMKSDVFVIMDHVQYARRGFQNRTMIKTAHGPQWVIVPVRQISQDEKIIDKLVDNQDGSGKWAHKMTTTIKHAYQGAPYFKEYVVPMLEVVNMRYDKLADLNIKLIELCREALEIDTRLVKSSEMQTTGH